MFGKKKKKRNEKVMLRKVQSETTKNAYILEAPVATGQYLCHFLDH